MNRINDFLYRHDVDVARSIAVLLFASAFSDITTTLGSWLTPSISLQLGFIISLPLGAALWRYSSGARKVCIGFTWLISALLAIITVWMLIQSVMGKSMQNFNLTISNTTISNPTLFQISIVSVFCALIMFLALSVVHSQKFRTETQESNKTLEI